MSDYNWKRDLRERWAKPETRDRLAAHFERLEAENTSLRTSYQDAVDFFSQENERLNKQLKETTDNSVALIAKCLDLEEQVRKLEPDAADLWDHK